MSFLDVYKLAPKVIQLNIKKQHVNIFLGLLWDAFRDEIGPVTCQHNYGRTDNPQIYEYKVRWSSSKFEAVLSFYNHTSLGLNCAELRLFDYEKNVAFGNYANKITNAILTTKDRVLQQEHRVGFDYYAKIKVLCGSVLSGSYHVDKLGVLLIASSRGCDLIFPAQYREAKSEFDYEAKKNAIKYVSALTVLSQELFLISENDDVVAISAENFQHLVEDTEFSGKYINDTPLYGLHGAKLGMPSGPDSVVDVSEVIMMERRDFRLDGFLCFPARLGELIGHIDSDLKRRQASKRFHDALRFREIHERYADGDFGVSYELIAYVASIEALLDHSKTENQINCRKCDTPLIIDEYKISQKFNDFVNTYGGGSEAMNRKFKELYGHRSKFVHTGLELHASNVLRPNRPLILEGKNHVSSVPSYYYNIHEWTGFLLRVYFYFTAYQSGQADSDNL